MNRQRDDTADHVATQYGSFFNCVAEIEAEFLSDFDDKSDQHRTALELLERKIPLENSERRNSLV